MSTVTIKLILIILLISKGFTIYGQKNLLLDKTWAYKEVAIIYQQDTLVMFHADSMRNIWYMGRVNLALKENGTYNGVDINGNAQLGTWSMPTPQSIIVDKDTNQMLSLSNRQFITVAPITYQDSNINITGTLLTVLYSVPDPTSICESIQSGDWTNSATWSCGREPMITDVVVVKSEHIITISASTAQAQRIIYQGGILKFISSNSKILVKGID